MTYAIGSFVFGINLKEVIENTSEQVQEDIELLQDLDLVTTEYSGNGDEPIYIGIPVEGLDECNELSWADIVKLKDRLKAAMDNSSPERIAFKLKIDAIMADPDVSDETKLFISKFEPEVFLTWGSS